MTILEATDMQDQMIVVKNAEGDPDTTARIVVQNQLDYTPKVSVIIPVYNTEEYLRECLDSVVNQTLKEIEIICVDDGSTDSSLEILKEYATNDKRITVLAQENLHAGVARNAGIAVARGEYLCFLDADDLFDITMAEKLYNRAKKFDADISMCRCKCKFGEDGIVDEKRLDYSLQTHLLPAKECFSGAEISENVFQFCQGWAWDKLFKAEFIKQNNIKFQNTHNTNDAYFVFINICLASKITYIENRLVCKYHQHKSSLSSNRNKYPTSYIDVIDAIIKRTKKIGIYDRIKKSFWKWAMQLSLIQLKVLNTESQKKIYSTLHKKFNEWNDYNIYKNTDIKFNIIEYIKENKEFPVINIAYSTNKKFYKLCLTSIISVLRNSNFEDINIVILHSELTHEDEETLKKLSTIKKFTSTFIKISDDAFEDFPLVWTSKETWYRCLLADLLPEIDKILYLDCDTIVRNSLLHLWGTNLGDNLIAAVEDISSSKSHAEEIGLEDNFYFNAGVLLLNLRKWRNDNFFKIIEDYVSKNDVFQADQGTLNKLTDNKKVRVSPQYNYMQVWWRENNCQYDTDYKNKYNLNPIIVHFTGVKPDDSHCKNKYKNEFEDNYKVLSEIAFSSDYIAISLASDNNYYIFMFTTIISILKNRSSSKYEFYLLVTKDFREEYRKAIMSLCEKYDFCKFNIINMEVGIENVNMKIKHITYPTYYRLYLADIVDERHEKCIYLDTDILVRGDLKELYNIDICDKFAAGVKAVGIISHSDKTYYKNIGIKDISNYVNAGVLLLNLKKIRQENMTPKLIEEINKNYKVQDQDIINLVFYGQIKTIGPKFNRVSSYDFYKDRQIYEKHYTSCDISEAINNPLIVHYADANKPWNTLLFMYKNEWKECYIDCINIQKKFIKKTSFGRVEKMYEDGLYSEIVMFGIKLIKGKKLYTTNNNLDKLKKYNKLLSEWYSKSTGKHLDIDNPQTFNEKIQWMKLYDSTPIKTRLADKYLVRDWVSEKIGEKYLIPLLGVYDNFDEIDFDSLPNRFVLKCNHGCAYNIIVKDKNIFDKNEARLKVQHWMKENFAFKVGLELHYRDIQPKIIIEHFIENESAEDLYDYKFWCFDGKVKYVQFLSERNTAGLKMAFYDLNWNKQSFVYSYPLNQKEIPRPDNLDEMIHLAEKLSKGFNHVRVDFYRLDDGTIYFGEMTFTSASGAGKWNDEKIHRQLGDWIKLPKMAYDINTGQYFKLEKPKKKLFKKVRFEGEKSLRLGPIIIYKKEKTPFKKRVSVFGIELFKRRITNESRKVYLLGLEVFKRRLKNGKKTTYLFGLPVYSIKKERYTLIRRILFFRYKKTNRIQELQDTLWHTQKLLENTRREVSALRSEVKSATSKPRRFVVTEIER